jgi:hypothetical protein
LRFRRILPIANAIGCLLFVVLREPTPRAYLAELDEVHRTGGVLLNSGILGMLACRTLHSWSEWHGGEALGVKVLEAANVFAFIRLP